MKVGDKVEVNIVWAANGPLQPLSRAWFKGYLFVEEFKDTILVKHESGSLAGVKCIYPKTCVRLDLNDLDEERAAAEIRRRTKEELDSLKEQIDKAVLRAKELLDETKNSSTI